MRMTLQLRRDVAQALQANQRGGTLAPAAQELLKTAKQLGLELKPDHPQTTDANLARYFSIDVPEAEAEEVRSRLQHCEATEAAYLKPRDELP